jgi:S-adenosylmethionine hydrolase
MSRHQIATIALLSGFCLLSLYTWIYTVRTRPVFVLMTDFGYDFAVGSIKGTLAAGAPGATIVDLDHTITKFSVVSGAFVLGKSYRYFPQGSIFIAVVDPGVGTARKPICIRTPHYTFIGPNNGLFDFVLEQEPQASVYCIDESYLIGKATTFHGRDLFAPAAVDCARGDYTHFHLLDGRELVHIVQAGCTIAAYIDSYGNVKTSYPAPQGVPYGQLVSVEIGGRSVVIPWARTFQDIPVGQLLCYAGSNGTIEIAVNQGSAASQLGLKVGDALRIEHISQ